MENKKGQLDFKGLNSFLLRDSVRFLTELLPGGDLRGKEYRCGDISGGSGLSLSVNIQTGVWKDFATGEAGGDFISLAAANMGVDQGAAYKWAADNYGYINNSNSKKAGVGNHRPSGAAVSVEPMDLIAPPSNEVPPVKGPNWVYRDRDGRALFYIERIDEPTGKRFCPWSWSKVKNGWVKKAWQAPRPIYGLEELAKYPDKPVMIVEGEKSCDAARSFISAYVVIAWSGGANAWAKTDWTSIVGRSKVLLWPDADAAGLSAMRGLGDHIKGGIGELKILGVPINPAQVGWDAANALAEGWDQSRWAEWAKGIVSLFDEPNEVFEVGDSDSDFSVDIEAGFTSTLENGKYIRNYLGLAAYLHHKMDATYLSDCGMFAIWDGKSYRFEDAQFIKNFAQISFDLPKCERETERKEFLNLMMSTYIGSIHDYNLRDTGLINFKNGVYCLKTKQLYPHDRKYKMSYILPCDYKSGPTPIWDELMKIITLNRPHFKKVIEEYIGYSMSACTYKRFNKMLLFDGTGSNGKSTVLRTIELIFGDKNVGSVGLANIHKNRFAAHGLANKLVNFCSEEPESAFGDTGPLKQLTGGDRLMVEEKNKPAYSYLNLAKFIISYNKVPRMPDDSKGFKRRPIIVLFDQDFDEHPELKLSDPEGQIMSLELSELATKCVTAFEKVIETGNFTDVPEGLARLDEVILESDPVKMFIRDCLVINSNSTALISTNELFENFRNYAGNTQIGMSGFARKLSDTLSKLGAVCSRDGNVGPRGYVGIQWQTHHQNVINFRNRN